MDIFFLTMIGLAGGVASGLLGVGGGVLFVPLLILILHFNSHTAIGTSLAVIGPTALVAAWRHALAGMVDWRAAAILVVFSLAGAWGAASLSVMLDTGLLRRLFAVLLLGIAVKMFFQN